jgi:hypothetical protein
LVSIQAANQQKNAGTGSGIRRAVPAQRQVKKMGR